MVFKRINSATFKRVVMFFLAIFVATLVLIGCTGKEVEKITLDKQNVELVAGDTELVKATVTPSDAKDKTVTWTTSDSKVATVSNGTITAVGEGEATITAKAGTKTAKVTVKVNAKTFTVTFNSNGGSPVTSLTVKDGEKANKPADPTQTGYAFNGWYTDAALTKAFNFTTTKVIANTTLYAKWRINKFTVLFDSNGGTEVAEQEVEYNKTISTPLVPEKEGYEFVGWYTDYTLVTEFNLNDKVTTNLNLYAKWATIIYDVTFVANGGSDVDAQEVLFNGKVIKPAVPTKAGYTFMGWFTDEALATEFDFATVLTDDITLYAKWELNVYTVTFNSNGGSLVEDVQVNHGAKLAKPTDPTLEGYLFKGWFTDAEFTTAYDFDTVVEGALTLFAKFEIDMTLNSIIEFELNGGSFPISSLGAFIKDDAVATATVHTLNETQAGYNAGSSATSLFLNDKNYTMAPSVWQNRAFLNKNAQGFYEVKLTLGAGSANVNPDLKLYEYVLFAHEGHKVGYDFVGALQVGQIIAIEGFDVTSIKTGKIDATVKVYNANANLVTNKATLAKEDNLPVPVKAHHTFVGWYANAELTGDAVVKATDSVKVFAKWEANTVKLTFDSKAGSAVDAIDVIYGQKVTQPADPTRTGYTFDGWFKDAEYATAFDFNVELLENTTVYAKWVALEYDVVYNVDGGTAIETHKAAHDSKIALPVEPTKEGNVFLGWYTEAEFTNLYNFDAIVTGQVNLFAKWAAKKELAVDYVAVYNETLKAYYIKATVAEEALDATSIKSIAQVRVAGEFIAPKALTPDTDTALWFGVALENANPNYKKAGVYTYVVVKQDDSVYAITFDYKPELVTELPYEVSFVVNGGSEVASQIIVKDAKATQPVDPTKLGHNFVGWFKDEALTEAFDFNSGITAITKVYAKWEAIKYTVTYNLNGATEFRYKTTNEMFVDLLTDFHTFLGSTEDLTVFMHGVDKTSGFAGTWATDANKALMLGATVTRPTEVNDELFISHKDYMDKWLPFFDLMQDYVKAVNAGQNFYGDSFVAYIRIGNFVQGTRAAYVSWAPKGWVAPDHYYVTTADFNLPIPSKDALVFAGWYSNAEFTGEKVTKIAKGSTGDVVLYARFVTAIHKVTYESNGGSAVKLQEVIEGEFATQPADPTKDGFLFAGWYTDAELKNHYDFNTAVTANLNLFAKWNVKELPALLVDANLEGEAGTKVTVNEVEYEVGTSAFKTFAEIAGKYADGATITVLKGTYDEAFAITKNNVKLVGPNAGISALDLTKRVEEAVISQVITVSGTQGLVIDGIAITGKAQIKASTPVKNFTAKNLNSYAPSVPSAEGVIFFGVATAEINDGFTVLNSSFVETGTGYRGLRVNNAKDVTVKNNYFKGFFDSIRLEAQGNSGTGTGVSGFLVVEDNKFEMNIQYPIYVTTWSATSVEINRNYIGVDPANKGTISFVYLNAYQPKEGVKSIVNITHNEMPYNTESNEFRLNSKGATAAQLEYNINYNIFHEIPFLDDKNVTRAHIIDHNTIESDFVINGTNNYFLYESEVLETYFVKATYAPFFRELPKEKFTVEFATNGGSVVENVEVESGSLLTQPVDPTKAGYTLVGWFTDEALTAAYDFNTPVTAGLKLYAKWAEKVNTITYNYNGGKLIYANKTEMIEDFLKDFYAYVKPTESLSDFMHGVGKTTGYDGTWHATHQLKIYAGPRPTEVNEALFISSAAYMEKWLPFFDMMDKFVKTVNNTQFFFGAGKSTGLARIRQYICNIKPSGSVTDATMAMMPDGYAQVDSFKISSADVLLPTPVKEGVKFLGWYNDAEFTGEVVTKVAKGTTGDVVLFAKWEEEAAETVTYTETFSTDIKSTYVNGTFIGDNGETWTYVHARNVGVGTADDSKIDGEGIMLRRVDESSSLSVTLTDVKSFSFQYRKAFTGGTTRTYCVDVTTNGATTTHTLPEFGSGTGAQETVYTFELKDLNITGEVTIKIYAIGAKGNQQASFDNFVWTV